LVLPNPKDSFDIVPVADNVRDVAVIIQDVDVVRAIHSITANHTATFLLLPDAGADVQDEGVLEFLHRSFRWLFDSGVGWPNPGQQAEQNK